MNGFSHDPFQLQQPFLHLSSCLGCRDTVGEWHHLTLTTLHVRDVKVISEHQVGYPFKALLQVRLDTVKAKIE